MTRQKEVTATQRLPLWKLSEEMYMERQLAPDPNGSWTEIRRQQARMREKVLEQQKKDMRSMERELSGWRFPPTYAIGDLRAGMWVDGRISATRDYGMMVDIGAYTENGEWFDGYVHCGQFREDGKYVDGKNMMQEVHLGEIVRVRIREVVPASGTLKLSMRTIEDLPALFMGKPRPHSNFDLERGMKLKGIVRRVWEKWAIVDIGSDRLARLHVRDYKRPTTVYGFAKIERLHKYAYAAYAVGAELDVWIKMARPDGSGIELTCNRQPYYKDYLDKEATPLSRDTQTDLTPGLPSQEKMSKGQRADREKAQQEKENWDPYVAHVDEWLEDAAEPDPDTDSWVAQQEMELLRQDEDNGEAPRASASEAEVVDVDAEFEFDDDDIFDDDEFADEDFADDEFADADFGGGSQEFQDGLSASSQSTGEFGEHDFSVNELDGWVLDDVAEAVEEDPNKEPDMQKWIDMADNDGAKFGQDEIETLFDAEDEDYEGYGGKWNKSGR